MQFIASRGFARYRDIENMGRRCFALLPLWIQHSPKAEVTLVIGHPSFSVETLVRNAKRSSKKDVLEYTFAGNISAGYHDFFGQFLKSVIDHDRIRAQVFMDYVRTLGFTGESNRLIVETLYRHLAWYFIAPGSLRKYNRERFDLCRKMADSLMFVGLPQGTLQ